jgi:two-component system sensor kinase FixL
MARVWVRDFGGGVSEEMAERLFEPFVTSKSLGTGMGLSISRTIVKAHGGQLWYENAEDGACFVFTLPLAVTGEQGD